VKLSAIRTKIATRTSKGLGGFFASITPAQLAHASPYVMVAVFATSHLSIAAGLDLSSPLASQIACLMLLVIGLPHGSFDWTILADGFRHSARSFWLRLGCYVALAGAVGMLWLIAPMVAMISFLLMAVVHFSEDWRTRKEDDLFLPSGPQDFLSFAIPICMITLAALSNKTALATVFSELTAISDIQPFVDGLHLLAPVALLVTFVKIFADWHEGARGQAVAGFLTIMAMLTLPPVIGFAVYFCFYHSPMHFAESADQMQRKGARSWWAMVLLVSAGGLMLAALFYFILPRETGAALTVSSVFITLSALTVPHMLMPLLIRMIARR
jgi:beta-carotene 15,15'-dioxygenase